MPAGTPPTLACLWKTAEDDMFGSEEAVDKALEFGVREFGQCAVAIPISLARLLPLKKRTRERSKMLDAFFSGVQKGADKLCVVPLQGKTRALGHELPREGQPWSYLLCCPFRYALLLDTYDTIWPEPRKQLLLRRAKGIAAGQDCMISGFAACHHQKISNQKSHTLNTTA